MMPLAIDLFCGLGGWTDGLLAEDYDVIGFDIEKHEYMVPESFPEADGMKGTKPVEKRGWTQGCAISLGMEGANNLPRTRLAKYPAQLVLQDVLTIHGSQFRNADLIVASPPCQEFSYMAMPWSRAKQIAAALRGQGEFPAGYTGSRTIPQLTALFDACFRIQAEASGAAGRYIPMVVENVRGAQPWVGRAPWNYGSFYLWGDVPALMPLTWKAQKQQGRNFHFPEKYGITSPAFNGADREPSVVAAMGLKTTGHANIRDGHGSKISARKAASAQIAKIPLELSRHIARVYRPAQNTPCNPVRNTDTLSA